MTNKKKEEKRKENLPNSGYCHPGGPQIKSTKTKK